MVATSQLPGVHCTEDDNIGLAVALADDAVGQLGRLETFEMVGLGSVPLI